MCSDGRRLSVLVTDYINKVNINHKLVEAGGSYFKMELKLPEYKDCRAVTEAIRYKSVGTWHRYVAQGALTKRLTHKPFAHSLNHSTGHSPAAELAVPVTVLHCMETKWPLLPDSTAALVPNFSQISPAHAFSSYLI